MENLGNFGKIPIEILFNILDYVSPYLFVLKACSKNFYFIIKQKISSNSISLRSIILNIVNYSENNIFHFMKWLNNQTSLENSDIVSFSIKIGNISILKWYCQNYNCMLKDVWCCNKAVVNNDKKLLEWLKSPEAGDCPWDTSTCALAAEYGLFDMLKFLRERGCPWDTDTFIGAILYGDLEIMKWLRDKNIHKDNVCPWEEICCSVAIELKRLYILEWMRNKKYHGEDICPLDIDACFALATDSEKIYKWLQNNVSI